MSRRRKRKPPIGPQRPRGRPTLADADRRTLRVQVKLNLAERERLEREARFAKQPVAVLIRTRALSKVTP